MAPDRVRRRFEASGPNRSWVADITGVTPFPWTLERALKRLNRSLAIAEWGDPRLWSASKSTYVDLSPKKIPVQDVQFALS